MKHDQKFQQNQSQLKNSKGHAILDVPPLDWTGERMVPEKCDQDTFLEHIYRYKFALPYAQNHDVLDIACGEGYGSAALVAGGARSVVGVDIDVESVEHARRKYNLQTRVGSAEAIPAADDEFDVVVSFETIEHVENPERFLDECARVCRPGGHLVISTPNKNVYLHGETPNQYHLSEMTPEQFMDCLNSRFRGVELFGQILSKAPWWSPRICSVTTSPLFDMPGILRIRSMLRNVCAPALCGDSQGGLREKPVDRIVGRDSALSNLFNPYLVRDVNVNTEVPCYLIAVATL